LWSRWPMPVPHLRRDARVGLATFDTAELTRLARRAEHHAPSAVSEANRRCGNKRIERFLLRPASDRARREDGRSDDHAPAARAENAIVGGHHGSVSIEPRAAWRQPEIVSRIGNRRPTEFRRSWRHECRRVGIAPDVRDLPAFYFRHVDELR